MKFPAQEPSKFAEISGHFYFKSGQPKTVGAQGIAGFVATFPLFFFN